MTKDFKCPKCSLDDFIMIEYGYGGNVPIEHLYDGISELKCKACGTRVGRWSGRILEGDDYEKLYGE